MPIFKIIRRSNFSAFSSFWGYRFPAMTAPTGRKMYFLTDPIEDWPRDWADYKKNYQATFTAQLLYPNIANYEVMPWPNRIYQGLYKTSADSDQKERIPRFYSTQMQVMINALNHMPLSDNKLSGSQGIRVLMSNTLMFQRFPIHEGYQEPQLSNFYGQALPFLKRGVPVKTMHLENVGYADSWNNTKILLMSYSNMKPLSPEGHDHIATWVKNGGVLVYCGRDRDPFQNVQEWWNTGGNDYETASAHLFEKLNIPSGKKEGAYEYGKGTVYIIRKDPKEFVMEAEKDEELIGVVKELYEQEANAGQLRFKNNFYLERGVYDLIAVLDESVSEEPYVQYGRLIDLFDPELPVLTEKKVDPGKQAFLLNLDRVKNPGTPQVLASASRVYDEGIKKGNYEFVTKSPLNTTNVMRVLTPGKPENVTVIDQNGTEITDFEWQWDEKSSTSRLKFENHPDGIKVQISW
ncbi:MAG: hypothetical protein R6V25_02630 [Desulfatiglandales bacterium]